MGTRFTRRVKSAGEHYLSIGGRVNRRVGNSWTRKKPCSVAARGQEPRCQQMNDARSSGHGSVADLAKAHAHGRRALAREESTRTLAPMGVRKRGVPACTGWAEAGNVRAAHFGAIALVATAHGHAT
jgi:hypothetical protein